MTFFYATAVQLYALLIHLAAWLSPKARLFVEGRKRLIPRMQEAMAKETRPVAWFHCASLGEFEQGRPVIEAFKAKYPDYAIVLTFFSPSGYEVRKNYAQADYVWYLPFDTNRNARRAVRALSPKIAFFVKYEFWYYFLRELHSKGVPVCSIAANFRESQPFFRWWGSLHRSMLHCFTHIFVQRAYSAKLLKKIGIAHATVCPDTRFDRVQAIAAEAKPLPFVETFAKHPCIVIGSAWEADLQVIAPAICAANMQVIVAPHEIDEATLKQTERHFAALGTVRYSAFTGSTEAKALIIDNIGMLSSLYRYGDMAYIGGAFGKGLHNILEAAVYGIPVAFGPKIERFQEAKDLILAKGGVSIADAQAWQTVLNEWLTNEKARLQAGNAATVYVQQHLGGTQQIMQWVAKYIR